MTSYKDSMVEMRRIIIYPRNRGAKIVENVIAYFFVYAYVSLWYTPVHRFNELSF